MASTAGNTLVLKGHLIHVDIDPTEFGKHYHPDLAITADAVRFVAGSTKVPRRRTSARRVARRPIASGQWTPRKSG